MDTATKVNIVLSILSFILALISIITVVITLRQNHTMIENATRPYLCIYGQSINPGSPEFYLVIKNFGASPATVTKFEYDPDLSNCYGFSPCRDFLSDIARCTFAPSRYGAIFTMFSATLSVRLISGILHFIMIFHLAFLFLT